MCLVLVEKDTPPHLTTEEIHNIGSVSIACLGAPAMGSPVLCVLRPSVPSHPASTKQSVFPIFTLVL